MNKEMIKKIAARMFAAWVLVIGLTMAAQAATLTVTKTADTSDGVCDADCSLREAIAAAAISGDEIVFSTLFDAPQIINVNGQLTISKNLTVTGKGANLLTIRNTAAASFSSRVFLINFGTVNLINFGTVNLSGMTITGGNTTDIGGGIWVFNGQTITLTGVHVTGNTASYGGIFVNRSVTLNLINSTVSNNTANGSNGFIGGGIVTLGRLNITNSTISGNRAPNCFSNCGGGIYKFNEDTITITDSTITDNEAAGTNSAGGIFIQSGTTTVRYSIIAANRKNTRHGVKLFGYCRPR